MAQNEYNENINWPIKKKDEIMYQISNKIELKERMTDNIKKEIVGFLNSDGGKIYVGVKKDGTILPITDLKRRYLMSLKVSNWVYNAFYPDATRLISTSFNKDNVFEIRVKQGISKPYYLKDYGPRPNGVFKRVGTSTRKATDNEILMMIMDAKNYYYENDIAEEQELTFKYFFQVCDKNNLSHTERNLVSLRIISPDGKYTNLGYLMSDQSNVVVKFAKYNKDINFLAKKEFSGSILKIIDEVLQYADTFNDVACIFDKKTFKRIDIYSYPGFSLREGMLNAIEHANYFLRSNIKIEFFIDKARIISPGGVYLATMDDILRGVQTYRNPGLVNILHKLGYIENYGSGIPRILKAYKNEKRLPIFESSDNFFFLTLPNLNYSETSDAPLKAVNYYQNVNDVEALILKTISESPGVNTNQLYELLKSEDLTLNKIRNILKRNLASYIVFKGSKKFGGYYLK